MTKKEFELPPVDYLVKSIFETLSRLPLRPRFQFRADTTEPLQSRYRRVEGYITNHGFQTITLSLISSTV